MAALRDIARDFAAEIRDGDLATDLAVLRQAQEAAAQLISQDRPLPSPLAQAIESLLAGSADTLN